MKKLTRNLVAVVIGMVAATASLLAAPALRRPQTIQQPNGTTITIVQQGDEWCHWVTNLEGQMLVKDQEGNYHVATLEEIDNWEKSIKPHNLQLREAVNRQRYQTLKKSRDTDLPTGDSSDNHAANFPSKGQIHGLIVLVEYDDVPFATDSAEVAQHYQNMIKSEGYSEYDHQGSAHDFFFQNSMGQFDPQFDIYGPLKLKHKRSYYGGNNGWGNDSHAYEMVIEACQQLDSLVDFSIYDNNNDGIIDFVFAFYAGGGEHAGAGSSTVWPHAWTISSATGSTYKFDNKKLDSYACSCELLYNQPDGVGTFCHEFTHVLGLPDIYDVNYSSSTFTPGDYDVLDQGSYNGLSSGSCPAALDTYERYELGWLHPETLVSGTTDTLAYLGESNRAYILPVKSSTEDPRDGEYYLFENRQQTGWDSHIPGHGMLIWHIDYQSSKWFSNNVNTTGYHQCVDIVEADDKRNMYTKSGDPFPGTSGITSFTSTTTPAFLGWDSHNSRTMKKSLNGAAITNIREVMDTLISSSKLIVFDYNDDSNPLDSTGTTKVVLFDSFDGVSKGSDKSITDSSNPFDGNDNFPEVVNAYQAGGAVRLGKLKENGSLTSRPLGNEEGCSLCVEAWVKGWSKVEGTLMVEVAGKEPESLEYTSTLFKEYEFVSCTIDDCPADAQISLSTSEKRCFITSVRVTAINPSHEDEAIRQISLDQAPAKQNADKVWINGQLLIRTGDGLFNMQGVRQ